MPFTISPADRELFRSTVGEVQRLHCDRIEPLAQPAVPQPRLDEMDAPQVLCDPFSDYFVAAQLDAGEELYYRRNGVQTALLRKLRRGYFRIGAELDLHGLSALAARQKLALFLHQVRAKGENCVRIIHGKGKGSQQQAPVLKQKVNTWLRQCDAVLAFCSTPAAQGGSGAVYVLLRRL